MFFFFYNRWEDIPHVLSRLSVKNTTAGQREPHICYRNLSVRTHRALWTPFSLCRIAQFSSACPIMSAQGCWACSVRDAVCPIVRVRAAASCDKSQHCLKLLFPFISLVVLRAVQYSTRMSPVASMMAETLPPPPPPPLRFMYPEAGE